MDKISTSELVAKISASTGFNKKMVKEILADQVAQINGHVENGVAVQITVLGKLYPHDRKARTMVCPKNGKETEVASQARVVFQGVEKVVS